MTQPNQQSKTQPWQERKVSLGASIIGVFVALVVGSFVGMNWNMLVNQFGVFLGGNRPVANLEYSGLDEIYQVLNRNFDGDIDRNLALEGAKRGLVASLGDRYTVFMNAREAADFNNSLHGDVGAGVGIELGQREGFVKVLRTLPDNPARRAGILAGDIIYKVDGQEVFSFEPDQIADLIRGEIGSEVTVTIVRNKQELDFTMTRERINNVSAYVDYISNVAVITITRFDSDTSSIMRSIADEINSRNINNIIVDLRGNGGGFVEAARDVLSLWVDGKLIMDQRSASGRANEKYFALNGRAVLKDKHTVVLTNGSTASAAEIMAGALRDYDLATLIGEQTFGKGSVQILLDLSGGNKVKVTIARWYTPNGVNINGDGLTPDIKVERSYDDINIERDPQLGRALEYVKK